MSEETNTTDNQISERARAKEIERRKKAGSAEIPKSYPQEKIIAADTVGDRLFLFSQRNIFRVRTSDDIDPDVTQENVPWAVYPFLSIGTQHPLIAGSFGVLRELEKAGIPKSTKQRMSEFLLEFAVPAAELEYAKTIYAQEVAELIGDPSNRPPLIGSAIQVPRIKTYEICFSIYFNAAKRATTKLIGMLEWAAGFPIKYDPRLDAYCQKARKAKKPKRLRENRHLIDQLDSYARPIRFLNSIRNSFEHPSGDGSILLKNVELLPAGNFRLPTFTFMHRDFETLENQDFGAHVEKSMEMLASFVEHAVLVSAAIKSESTLPWQASIRDQSKLNPDYPVKWQIDVGLPDAISSHLNSHKPET